MTEFIDVWWYKFDLFVAQDCAHFVNDEENPYMETMMHIQSESTILFFILIHIPLSRLHSSVSFLTGFIPIFTNMRTKYWFYEKANSFVCIFYPDAKNKVKKSREQTFESKDKTLDLAADIDYPIKFSRSEREA